MKIFGLASLVFYA